MTCVLGLGVVLPWLHRLIRRNPAVAFSVPSRQRPESTPSLLVSAGHRGLPGGSVLSSECQAVIF